MGAVVVGAAGAQVRAGEAHVAQPRPVGAAADGDADRGQAGLADGFLGAGHHVRVLGDDFLHVPVLLADGEADRPFPVEQVHGGGGVPHLFLFELELVRVMVADDVAQLRRFLFARKALQVEEALVALGGFRYGMGRQQAVKLHAQLDGVHHQALGGARVDAVAVEDDQGSGGVEVFVLDAAGHIPVHGVGKVRPKAVYVEQVRPAADLLVRGKADLHRAVRELRMGQQIFRQRHDLRDAGLVVRPKKRGAVRHDQLVADLAGQAGIVRRLHDDVLILVQHDVPALIAEAAGPDIGGGHAVHHVHVGDQADDRLALGVGGDFGVNVAVLVHPGVFRAQVGKLLGELSSQLELVLRGRAGRAVLLAAGVDGDIAQKPFDQIHAFILPGPLKGS